MGFSQSCKSVARNDFSIPDQALAKEPPRRSDQRLGSKAASTPDRPGGRAIEEVPMTRFLAHGLCRSLELAIAFGVIAAAIQISEWMR
jgi:hypothetical protein